MREKWKHFNTLPEELREFAANPQNIGFIEVLKDGDYRFHVEIDGQDDTIVLTPMEVFHEIISFI